MFKTSPQLTLCSYEKVRAGVGMGRLGEAGADAVTPRPLPRPAPPPRLRVGGGGSQVPFCSKQEPGPSSPTVLSAHRGTCSTPHPFPAPTVMTASLRGHQ